MEFGCGSGVLMSVRSSGSNRGRRCVLAHSVREIEGALGRFVREIGGDVGRGVWKVGGVAGRGTGKSSSSRGALPKSTLSFSSLPFAIVSVDRS